MSSEFKDMLRDKRSLKERAIELTKTRDGQMCDPGANEYYKNGKYTRKCSEIFSAAEGLLDPDSEAQRSQ